MAKACYDPSASVRVSETDLVEGARAAPTGPFGNSSRNRRRSPIIFCDWLLENNTIPSLGPIGHLLAMMPVVRYSNVWMRW